MGGVFVCNSINVNGFANIYEIDLNKFKVLDLRKEETLCDIGTGAGFPGMVLKILFPNLKVTLIDALEKRIKFLNDVIGLSLIFNKLNTSY